MSKSFLSALVGLILIAILALPGCEKRREEQRGLLLEGDRAEPEYVIALVLDCSGSYLDRFKGASPRAYQFFLKLTTRYASERGDSDDLILISQISQAETVLLWEGTPRRLRKDFGSPEAFRDFLLSRTNPSGSRVYAGITRTIERLLEIPAVQEGRARSAIFVLSDMDDTDGPEQKGRLLDALRRYVRLKSSAVGLYWVNQNSTAEWSAHLKDSGLPPTRFVCLPEHVSEPQIPRFD